MIFLDCTLRDGSYVNNFQMSQKDTFDISKGLDESGFKYIEVGHGVGLGASMKLTRAACTDEEYMHAASEAIVNSKWGMFCIPGIASIDDLKMSHDYGIDFVRIGVEFNKFSNSYKFIEYAQKTGVEVFVNFMKSHTLPPNEFAKYCKEVWDIGVDGVYLVDSSGSMLPDEVSEYIKVVKQLSPQALIGFHGHNNLGLANCNSLTAIKSGASIVDVSLHGLGRSSGNARSEEMVAIFEKEGIKTNIDLFKLIEVGDNFVSKFSRSHFSNSLDLISGVKKLHSSFLNPIIEFANQRSIDPRLLILSINDEALNNIDDSVLEDAASKINKKNCFNVSDDYFGNEESFINEISNK